MADEKTTGITNAKQLIALAKAFNQTKSKIGSINGEIGERIAQAVENGNLHPGAFKFVCSLARKHEKDEHKALEFWRQVLVYHEEFEKSGLFGNCRRCGLELDGFPVKFWTLRRGRRGYRRFCLACGDFLKALNP